MLAIFFAKNECQTNLTEIDHGTKRQSEFNRRSGGKDRRVPRQYRQAV